MKIAHFRTPVFPVHAALAAAALGLGVAAPAADQPTLKDAYKGDFYVGVAINRTIAMSASVRADNVNRNLDEVNKDAALAVQQFNQISPENDLKWALVQPNEGPDGYNFGPADAYVNFGVTHNMYIVGHTLVWHSQTPNWVWAGTNVGLQGTYRADEANNQPPPATAAPANGTNAAPGARGRRGGGGGGFGFNLNTPHASRDEMLQRIHDHISTVVGRYKGKIKVWDVVNEAIADGGGTNILRDSPWSQIIGPDFIAKAFTWAHEADPDAILRYNDYNLEQPGKRAKLITLVKSLQAQHVPIMAIGTQTHVSVSGPSFAELDKEFTDLEQLGLQIHVTEMDVNGAAGGQRNTGADVASNAATTQGGLVDSANQKLADEYAVLFRAFLKHKDSVKVITFWGINDSVSWRAAGRPLLFDGNDQPKAAFQAVIDVAKNNGGPL